MVVDRKIGTYKYVVAGVISLLVFTLGVSFGMLLDYERVKWIEERDQQRDLDYESLQFQYLYLSYLDDTEKSCKLLKTTLQQSVKDLDFTLSRLISYRQDTEINNYEYEILQRRYILNNIQYWLFANEAKEECGNVDVATILYFYSGKNCPTCSDQGVALTYYKKIFEEKLLVFPIDLDLEEKEPMISILRDQYEIEDAGIPSIVVGDTVYHGGLGIADLKQPICSEFKEQQEKCESFVFELSSEQ